MIPSAAFAFRGQSDVSMCSAGNEAFRINPLLPPFAITYALAQHQLDTYTLIPRNII